MRNDITPAISGHSAFKLRVAINALDLVTRQLALEQGSDAAEVARLTQLLGMQGSLGELNRALADRIAKGEADLQTPGLADHLWQTTLDKLAVDQPNYAAYRRELGERRVVIYVGVAARLDPTDTHNFLKETLQQKVHAGNTSLFNVRDCVLSLALSHPESKPLILSPNFEMCACSRA